MINRSPLELEPPEPMQPPPLRRTPFPNPHIGSSFSPDSRPSLRLFIRKDWN